MNLRPIQLTLVVVFATVTSFAQIEGDNLFAENQVITVNLDFYDANFYSTLNSNYGSTTYILADLTITDNTGTTQLDSVGVRLKGNSSYNHPGTKKAFKIDLNKFVLSQDYDGLKKLNFGNGFKDPTLIREKVLFDFCHEVGVLAPRSNFVNVSFNNEPWGFYTLVEQIDDQFLDWAIEDDDGNLFKAGDNFDGNDGEADLDFYGTNQGSYENRYELKTNEEVNDWTDLIEFLDFINNSSDTDFEAQLADKMELTDFLRSAAINNLFSNLDTYTGSARNYYIYHNMTTDKWEWVKWDGNECFGSYTNGVNGMTTLNLDYVNSGRPLLQRIFDNENLYNMYLTELCYLTENYFNPTYMDVLIDELKDLAQESVYADDNKMFDNEDFDENIENDVNLGMGPGGGTYYGLKSFVEAKSNYVAGQVNCDEFNSIKEEGRSSLKIYPNPTSGVITIESPSAEMSNVAVYSSQGNVVLIGAVSSMKTVLDLSEMAPGLYLIDVLGLDGKVHQQRVVVE